MSENKFNTNNKTALFAVSNVDNETPVYLWADPATHALVTSGGGGGGGGGTQYTEGQTTAPATITMAGARYSSSAPTLTNGQIYGLQSDVNGNLKVTIASGGSSGTQYADGAARGTATGTLMMVDDGTNIQSASATAAGVLRVDLSNTTANATAIKVDGSAVTQPISGSIQITNNGVVSTVNSSTTTLLAGAVFTGTSEDVSNYSAIQVSVISDVASATDGLSIQQSSNGTNWDFTDTYTIAAATGKVFSVQPSARFLRVVYTNGGTNQASFRLQTVYHIIAPNPSSQRSADAYTNETDFTQNWTFNSLYNGTTWDRMRGDITNGLDVDVTRLPSLVAGAATIGSIASITTSIVPGTAATNAGKARDAVAGATDTGVSTLFIRRDAPTAATPAAGDYEIPQVDGFGSQWVRPAIATNSSNASVAASATSVTLLAANTARKLVTLNNVSTIDCYVKFGTGASTSSFNLFIAANGSAFFNGEDWAGIVTGIWASASGNMIVGETTP